MFKIITPGGATVLTEDPHWIRVHSENCFVLCKRERAEGISYKGTPFLFENGTQVYEVDAGDTYMTIEDMAAAIREGVNDV